MQDTESAHSSPVITADSTAGTSSESPANPATMQEQVAQLRKLLTATLLALLIIGLGLDLYLLRQMMTMRKDLQALRPTAIQLFDNDRKEKPQIQYFVSSLQNYSRTHPEFTPIFNKYVPALTQLGLIAGSPAAAAMPATSAPLSPLAAPGLK